MTTLTSCHRLRVAAFFQDILHLEQQQLARTQLEDYAGSGFDRGHMAPAGDMASEEAMTQGFSLANIIPQAPINNRKVWAKIEKDTRKYVMRAKGDVYVIKATIDTHLVLFQYEIYNALKGSTTTISDVVADETDWKSIARDSSQLETVRLEALQNNRNQKSAPSALRNLDAVFDALMAG